MSTPPVKLSFGGLKKPITKLVGTQKKPFNTKLSFEDDDDEPIASTSKLPATTTTTTTTTAASNSRIKISTSTLSRAQKAKQAADIELDSTIYEYDEVYDNMKEGSRLAEVEKKKDAGERKPKYIARLLETAEVRKRDRVRAEDKMVQREREKEGVEFADKDEFVTPAYKAQQEELRRIEEEEEKKDAAAAASAKPGSISSFLKNHREATSIAHDAAVAASLNRAPIASTTTNAVRGPARQTEAELAAEVSARTGRRIEVNDDGIIIDKRELLSGGLNIIARPRTETGNGGISNAGGFAAPISARTAPNPSSTTASAANPAYPVMSAAERAQQSRERQSREIERQMIEMESRKKREAEELLEVRVAKVAKRNDSSKVEELKRKAEERRRKREEEAKAAIE